MVPDNRRLPAATTMIDKASSTSSQPSPASGVPQPGIPGVEDPRPVRSASDVVFAGLLKGVEARTFVPGQRLVETDLAEQFGVGRNSVREAMQRLAACGIVELSRHRGAAIRRLSPRETDDVLDVAERMTGLLARTACRGSAEPRHRETLERVLRELAQCGGDPAAFSAARRTFYRTLLEMGDNKELRRLFPTVQMPTVHAQFRLPQLQEIRLEDYGRIARAVLAADAEGAERAAVDHVRHVRLALIAEREADARSAATDPEHFP
jgi:DNA-binding GntR family transcriptional regulator